ncbi:MAG: hypothetical protein LBK13_03620 [Spirochaetales bacterium]|nr:hypothetical protein [Spirochaetales bacterium]
MRRAFPALYRQQSLVPVGGLYKFFYSGILMGMFRFARKGLFIVFLVCVMFFAVFAETFIADHFDHDCSGESCTVCLHIQTVQNLLKCLGLIILLVSGAGLVFRTIRSLQRGGAFRTSCLTPVALKVRLNS